MRISDLRIDRDAQRQVASALFSWEHAERAPRLVHFSIEAEADSSLAAVPEAFLIASLLPALAARESRIAIDAAISPALLRTLPGVLQVMQGQRSAAQGLDAVPTIEAEPRREPVTRPLNRAAFVSADLSDLDLLLAAPCDPDAARLTAITVTGLESPSDSGADSLGDASSIVSPAINALINSLGISAVHVSTNLGELRSDEPLWQHLFERFSRIAVTYCLNSTIGELQLATKPERFDSDAASAGTVEATLLYGLSSELLDVWVPRVERTWLDRLAQVARSPVGRAAMHVCPDAPAGSPHCGVCRDCVQTALALTVLGLPGPSGLPMPAGAAMLRKHPINSARDAARLRQIRAAMLDPAHALLAQQLDALLADWRPGNGISDALRGLAALRHWLGGEKREGAAER